MHQAKNTLPRLLLDLPKRTFATLTRDEAASLVVPLRPLPWVDGLITAAVIAPEEPEDWIDHLWVEDEIGKLTLPQTNGLLSVVLDQFGHVADMLCNNPRAYRPFLGAGSDQVAAAAQWATGFRFGIRLNPEQWAPLIDDDNARAMLALIFCLERDEGLVEPERADAPFRDITPERREEMRRDGLALLPAVICGLNEFSLALGTDDDDEGQPFMRGTPKIGRNEPCPCGSGKKYKKCCLGG
jgi:uncharacterized protein